MTYRFGCFACRGSALSSSSCWLRDIVVRSCCHDVPLVVAGAGCRSCSFLFLFGMAPVFRVTAAHVERRTELPLPVTSSPTI